MNTEILFNNMDLYKAWRDRKLAAYPYHPAAEMIDIADPYAISPQERSAIVGKIAHYNLALYRLHHPEQGDKQAIHQLAASVGLDQPDHNLWADQDSLSSISVSQRSGQQDFIPYTDKPLSWHTDGYYNSADKTIRGMLLHCVRPAHHGGMSLLMDPDIAYILLYEADPAFITALTHPKALTIPANVMDGKLIRAEQSGPVFTRDTSGQLHMRYSARQRNIIWRNDPVTQAAVDFLQQLWQDTASPYLIQYTLQAGEGLLCNNVLHRRTAFIDHEQPALKRLLYRGRYLNRIHTTTDSNNALFNR